MNANAVTPLNRPASAPAGMHARTAKPELTLLLADSEGALVRILGLIERRGFRLGTVSSELTPHGTRLSLTLASHDRPADVLLRQVARLHDVLEAALDIRRQPQPVSRVAP